MPKYVAVPVTVTAQRIVEVKQSESETYCILENGNTAIADAGMTARYTPVPGDYWVQQEDGYEYLNPKHVFERKYQPIELMNAQLSQMK